MMLKRMSILYSENEYKWIFSKHHDWENEKEWRIVVPQGNQLWPMLGEIKTVTFGLLMDKGKRVTNTAEC